MSLLCTLAASTGARADHYSGGWGGSNLDIDRASWSSEYDRLRVEGSCSGRGTVTVTNAGNGAAVGSDNCNDGSYRVSVSYSNSSDVPCRVRAEQGSAGAEHDVSNAPNNCDDGSGGGGGAGFQDLQKWMPPPPR